MAGRAVPERLSWAVERLAVGPGDRLLEIGCGHGVAAALICDRLRDGTLTAIDQSTKMIEVAAQRNAAHIAAGRAEFRTAALADVEFPDGSFDKVLAVNINLFWTRSPATELALIRRLLAPGGALYLIYEPPDAGRAASLAAGLSATLSDHGYTATASTGSTSRAAALVCLTGYPR